MAMLHSMTALQKMLICVYFPAEWLFYEWHLCSYGMGESMGVIIELLEFYECSQIFLQL